MNAQADQALIEKLKALPPQRRAEVADFVDFLVAKERGEALEAFLAVADQVAQAGVPALSPEEIEAEFRALRAERRARRAPGG
jgi:hypothetical protein